MRADRALFQALDLAITPGLANRLRRKPLPENVLEVIRIAAGCETTLDKAATLCRREPQFVKSAAEFYVLQIVLYPGADCYRMLGVHEGASREVIRSHLRWLALWLHPDRSGSEWQSGYARLVLEAWREIDGRTTSPSRGLEARDIQGMIGCTARRPLRPRAPLQRRRYVRASHWIAVAALLAGALVLFGPVRFSDLATAQGEPLDR